MLYEIWSLGHKPFQTVATDEVCVYLCVYGCVYLVYALNVYILVKGNGKN